VIISGEEEGVFGWLSVNLLLNSLTPMTDTSQMYGALDMGGESTQISYAALPSSDILEDCTVMRMFGINHRVYSHSFLTYGMNNMRSRVQQLGYDKQKPQSQTKKMFNNPCLLVGYNDTVMVMNDSDVMVNVVEKGEGSTELCGEYIRELFYNETFCVTDSCSILGIYQPFEYMNNITFYAFSNFAYTINDLQLAANSSLADLNAVAEEICSMTWKHFLSSKWGKLLNETGQLSFASDYCYELTYIFTLLHYAYQIPLENSKVIFTNVLMNAQLGWTQGSILRDINWMPFDLDQTETTQTETTKTSDTKSFHPSLGFGLLLLGFFINW